MKTIGLIGPIGVNDIGDVILLKENILQIEQLSEKKPFYNIFTFDLSLSESQLKDLEVYKEQRLKLIRNPGKEGTYLTGSDLKVDKDDFIRSIREIREGLLPQIWNKDFIDGLTKCDGLYFIGGGYFNSYWGRNLYTSFIFPMQRAFFLKKRVFVGGVTIGPFAENDLINLHGAFNECDKIILRDVGYSRNNLIKLGFPQEKVCNGCDDAVIFTGQAGKYYEMEQTKVEIDIDKGNFAVLTLHPWLYKFAKEKDFILAELSRFCHYLINEEQMKIVYLPFNLNRQVDYLVGLDLRELMEKKESYFLLEPMVDYYLMRCLIRRAGFVLSSRYHPLVFATGENTNFLGIVVNDLYQIKLGGACRVVNLTPEDYLMAIKETNSDRLVHKYHSLNRRTLKSKKQALAINEQRKEELKQWLNSL